MLCVLLFLNLYAFLHNSMNAKPFKRSGEVQPFGSVKAKAAWKRDNRQTSVNQTYKLLRAHVRSKNCITEHQDVLAQLPMIALS